MVCLWRPTSGFTPNLALEGELESIYILPEHQRQKLGTQLIIALAKWFTEWDAKEVCIDRKEGNSTLGIPSRQHAIFGLVSIA